MANDGLQTSFVSVHRPFVQNTFFLRRLTAEPVSPEAHSRPPAEPLSIA